MQPRWQNQEEAMQFALQHSAVMLDLDMGCGKTRVAIDTVFARHDSYRTLVVCPKAVVPVWRENLEKFAPPGWTCWDLQKGTVAAKADSLKAYLKGMATRQFVVMNYDCVWRKPMGDLVLKAGFSTVILDESHRAKAAGSKVSKYLAMLGRRVKYRMCLSGTPMANSPLDVYGQYRFLDPSIFGTNHYEFLSKYAVMGGPERRFVVGFKNQKELNEKFQSIAYTCRMSDIASRLKLPEQLPVTRQTVTLPPKDCKLLKELGKEFITECKEGGAIVVSNVLSKMIRMQQIASGYCVVQDGPAGEKYTQELNTAKAEALEDLLSDISPEASVAVFCVFVHDLDTVAAVAAKTKRRAFELSGRTNQLDGWKKNPGGVIAVQIRAGAEGVDMTNANHAIYFSLPYSLAQYNQSKARLYRPGQTRPVHFCHLIAEGTIDEAIYKSLVKKHDVIDAIKDGTFDYGFIK